MPYYYYGFDWTYIVLVLPCLILSLWASAKVNSTFKKYSRQRTLRGLTAQEAAMRVLSANGVSGVRIERVSGNLTDHYDPRANVIRLSDSVYDNTSTAAIGVACHEAGHAVQYAQDYAPIKLRAAIIPVTNIGSKLAMPLILLGILFSGLGQFSDTIIYIGKAKRLRIRVSQYFREGVPHDNKVSQMIAHAYAFDVIVCQSEFEALVLEASQIKAHTPKYNILLKDDKGYSYIKVTKEPWPRLSFVLQKEEDDAEYIGPYTSSFAARQMAETAMDAFLLPRCNKRFPQEIGKGRPCLNAHIGKCMAVCSGRISCENYNQAVKSAVHLIRYGKKDILKILNERMQEASDRLEFETAALLRDQIAAITKVSAGQKVIVDPDVEMDVVALAGTPDSVCAAVLRFRDGRLTDKREFLFHDTSDIAAVREEFLPRYYLDDEQIPKIIAVDELPPDSDALQQALNEKRGNEVQLYVPQRGDKAHLVEMAHTNAVERLARESGRYAREEKLLDELAQVLGLAKPPRAIESYDISNWGDGSSVCGMVTFKDGKPYKAGYRRFKMKTVAGTDDYA